MIQQSQLINQTLLKQPHPLALGIVIPAKNEAKSLKQTLPALFSALEKFPHLFKIILIDDHSTDDTVDIATTYNIEVHRGQGTGPGAARNLGAQVCLEWMSSLKSHEHKWLLFLDADCKVTSDHFEVILPYLQVSQHKLLSIRERPRGDSWIQKTGSPSKRILHLWMGKMFSIPVIHAGCLYMQGPTFSTLKGFNSEYLCEDIDLGMRLGMSSIKLVNKPIVTEISDRRLSRLGLFSTIGIPARCTAMMFLIHNILPNQASQSLLNSFQKLGETYLPIQLWWDDPNRLLEITLSDAFKIFFLWVQLLTYLQFGILKPKESLKSNLSLFPSLKYPTQPLTPRSHKSKIAARD